MSEGKYRVILADPPWDHYNGLNYRGGRFHAVKRGHYDVMPASAIARLPVAPLVADNAACFMWACASKLPDAFAVLEGWGFKPVTVAFTWVKLNRDGTPFMSLGQYTRQNAEVCLLGIRGKMRRRRQHSRKPDEQYERIMRLFDGPYLELFARQQWPGWDVWGNQAGKFPAQPFLIPESGMAS